MYRSVPTYTSGQELATRYWWNLTQLAAAAVQDVFLIVYSTLDDTNDGTKSIADYCRENQKEHVTQELIEEGYDEKKFTSNPCDVFFDLQLTRKIMDKILVTEENVEIYDKIRKKIRWLSYQRNDVCHEMLNSIELLKLKLKLGNLRGILKQLYNLASQFSNLSRDTTDEALEYFLDELDVHRSITTIKDNSHQRFRPRRLRKFLSEDQSSEDSEESEEEQNSSDRTDSTDKSETKEISDNSGENHASNYYNKEDKGEKEVMEIIYEDDWNKLNTGLCSKCSSVIHECKSINEVSDTKDSYIDIDNKKSVHNKISDDTFQEVWSLQGSTLMVQLGLYCSKGWKNQYENFQTTLPSGHQLMLFWQRCLCDSHKISRVPLKSYFVPPKVNIRTRSKSLGRNASRYLLKRHRLAQQNFKAKREKSVKENRNLWNILKQIEVGVPEVQKGIFGNKWEDMIRREETIVAIENWEVLIAEEEWINEGWGDFQDLPDSSELESKCKMKTYKEADSNQAGKHDFCPPSNHLRTCLEIYPESFPSENVECSEGKRINIILPSITVILLCFVMLVSTTFSILAAASVVAAFLGNILTALLNLFTLLTVLCDFGCVAFVAFLVVKFLLLSLVSIIKIASVILYFVQCCESLERRSSEAIQRLNDIAYRNKKIQH